MHPVLSLVFSFLGLVAAPFGGAGHFSVAPPHRPPLALVCGPRPCVFPTSTASLGPQPESDTSISVDPLNRLHVVTAANDYNCPSLSGTYASLDGGRTWTRTCAGILPNAIGEGSPDVVYDRHGLIFRSSSDENFTGGVAVERSGDGGITWGPPVRAVSALVPADIVDQPVVTVDANPASPLADTVYAADSDFDSSSNTEIAVAHSSDHGATWTTVPIGAFEHFPTVNQFPTLATGPDGTVYVSWLRCTAGHHPRSCGGTVAQMLIARSSDGGMTWSAPMKIHLAKLPPDTCRSFYGCLPNSKEPLSDVPQLSVDNSNSPRAGLLYVSDVTYERPGRVRARVTTSADGGMTWSAPVYLAVPQLVHDQFSPVPSVGNHGILGVAWLDRRNDPANVSYQPFATVSVDGAASFSNAVALTNALSNPQDDGFQGSGLGEHIGSDWSGGSFYSAWIDTSNTVIGLDVTGGMRP